MNKKQYFYNMKSEDIKKMMLEGADGFMKDKGFSDKDTFSYEQVLHIIVLVQMQDLFNYMKEQRKSKIKACINLIKDRDRQDHDG